LQYKISKPKKLKAMKSNYAKLLMLVALLWTGNMYANNIQVTINNYDAALKKLNVTLSWENSWHDGTGTFRDAAWVFIKYKDATMSTWQTAPINVPTPATFQSTGNNVRFEAIGKNGFTNTTAVDWRGLIIRRAKTAGLSLVDTTMTGIYNVSMTITIPFVFAGTPANPEFKVFALEMVDVPQGAFYAGDGSGYSYVKTDVSNSNPKNIINESAIAMNVGGTNVSVPATFPKGFNEFYAMKYELSQEGYAEFLNTLTRLQQNLVVDNPVFAAATGNVPTAEICAQGSVTLSYYTYTVVNETFNINSRQGVKALCNNTTDAAVFSCDINQNGVLNEVADGQNLPIIPLRISSILYYLDWAGLSPMTALEFEKAARGPVYPVQSEFSWGSTTEALPAVADVDLNGPAEAHTTNYNGPAGYIGSYSPLNYRIFRCGAFAKPSGSTRLTSGGSYYGIMDLSNNAFELVCHMSNGLAFTNSPGNGDVNDVFTWGDNYMQKGIHDIGGTIRVGRVSDNAKRLDLATSNQNTLNGIRGVIR
jgi:hypothetical protein